MLTTFCSHFLLAASVFTSEAHHRKGDVVFPQAVLTVVVSVALQFLTPAGTRAQSSGSYASLRTKVRIFSTTFSVTQLWGGRGSGIPRACRPAVLPNCWSSGSVGEPVSKKGRCVNKRDE